MGAGLNGVEGDWQGVNRDQRPRCQLWHGDESQRAAPEVACSVPLLLPFVLEPHAGCTPEHKSCPPAGWSSGQLPAVCVAG